VSHGHACRAGSLRVSDQSGRVRTVSLGLPKIIDNHVPDFFAAVLLGQKVLSECCCSDFGEVLMLCKGEYLSGGGSYAAGSVSRLISSPCGS
jgi:hypothetical protein